MVVSFKFDYFIFFRSPVHLCKERVGCANEGAVSINEVISRIPKEYREQVFIKMDIEGSEYRVLDEIVDNASVFSGLVIEFHDADLHIDRISNFLNQFLLLTLSSPFSSPSPQSICASKTTNKGFASIF